MALRYFKELGGTYLISAPAPLGRILNYIKRIKSKRYKTSMRGVVNQDNLDNWTIRFMIGLGLVEKRKGINFTLTEKGNIIFGLIKDLPDFVDRKMGAKKDTETIKEQLKKENPFLYKKLREIFMDSDPIKNLAIYFNNKGVDKIDRHTFYSEFGKLFNIKKAGFNRITSSIQLAEFCDVLIEEGKNIMIYDPYYIKDFSVLDTEEIIREEVREQKTKTRKPLEIEEDFFKDIDKEIKPQKRKVLVNIIYRDSRIAKKLKQFYKGKCQICGFTFKKRNGEYYSEGHHIIPLGKEGADDIKNIIIVCGNCHNKLHHAEVKFGKLENNKKIVIINNEQKDITYLPEHFKVLKD